MFTLFNLRQARIRMKNHKNIFIAAVMIGFVISLSGCEMLGMGTKKEPPPAQPTAAPAPPSSRTEPPPAPSASTSTSPPVSVAKETRSTLTPPPPPVEPKTEGKPTPPPAEIYVITLKNSHVRKEPNLKGKIITTLKKGTKVEKIGQTQDWVNVKLSSGEAGYIFHELVKELE